MKIAKRITSIFLCLILCFCICFQCAVTSHAVFGIDDAILIAGLTCELLGAGITIYSVSQFVQSPTFNDFANSVVDGIDRELSLIKLNGQLFFDMTKLGWMKLTNWVKSHFNGSDQTIDYEYNAGTGHPTSITCADGTVIPYQGWMQFPFFIYNSVDTAGRKWAYWVQETNAGMTVAVHSVSIFCAPKSEVHWGYFENGEFVDNGKFNTMQDQFFKGERGGYQQISFNNRMFPQDSAFYQYRTIDIIVNNDTGASNPDYTTQEIPTTDTKQTVKVHSDANKYPGAIDSAATNIKDGEHMLVKVPDRLVVDDGQGDLTLTTDAAAIGDVVGDLTVEDVQPKVLTDTAAEGVESVVDNVIADTATPEITGNAQADIETANKFRLPKSFLEGFPFSIPYSIFVGIKSFVAPAEAPIFDIPISFPRLGINERIIVDLNQFNPLAKLCRALLSIVWVAGLAMSCGALIKH